MNIPQKFTQGDTFTWTDRTGYYLNNRLDNGEWNLTVSFRGPAAIDLTATRQFDAFTFNLDQATAKQFVPGRYRWVSRLSHIDTPTVPFSQIVIGNIVEGNQDITDIISDISLIQPGMKVLGDFFSLDTTVASVDVAEKHIYLDKPVLTSSTFFQAIIQSVPVDTSPFAGVTSTIDEGTVEVLPDITQYGAGFDARTQNERDLEAVDQAMRAMISGGAVQEYQIGNRSVKKMSMEALQTLRSRLLYQIARERKAKSGDSGNVLVRFTR